MDQKVITFLKKGLYDTKKQMQDPIEYPELDKYLEDGYMKNLKVYEYKPYWSGDRLKYMFIIGCVFIVVVCIIEYIFGTL